MATPRPGIELRQIRRVVWHVGAVQSLAHAPWQQRARAIAALGELAGNDSPALVAAALSGQPWACWFAMVTGRRSGSRCLARLGQWLSAEVEDSDAAAPSTCHVARGLPPSPTSPPPPPPALRLFVVELVRLHRAGQLATPAPVAGLTRRQQQVLEAILTGQSTRQIGQSLGVGRRTVEQHVELVCRKFNVRTRAQLMAKWIASPAHATPCETGQTASAAP